MTTTSVPLSLLDPGGDINARSKSERDISIDTLANSIAKLGLLQPLLVRQEGDRYRVIDGNRRLAALSRITAENPADPERHIPVQLLNADDSDAHTMSLAANIERLPMHEVDQYEAFAAQASNGKTVAEIASVFGISERRVQQRLALGNLPREIREEFRAGKISADIIRACANADPKLLKKVWKEGLRGWQLRDALAPANATGVVSHNERLALFAGRDNYIAAGGTFVTDLFIDEDKQLWADRALAFEVARAQTDVIIAGLLADGWSFAKQIPDGWARSNHFPEGEIDKKKFTDKDDFKRWKELTKLVEAAGEDEDVKSYTAEIDHLESYYDARGWSDEQKAKLGAVITADWEVVYGIDPPLATEGVNENETVDPATGEVTEKPPVEEPTVSAAINADLEMHLTHAMQRHLFNHPKLAKILLIDELYRRKSELGYMSRELSMTYDDYRGTTMKPETFGLDAVKGLAKLAGLSKAKNFAGRIKAWAKLSDDSLDQALAYFISQSLVNQRPTKETAKLLDDDGMKIEWRPTVENFFGRLTKGQLGKLIDKHKLDVVRDQKKGALAEAVRAALPEDWLPDEILP